jgi:hypothetical protein
MVSRAYQIHNLALEVEELPLCPGIPGAGKTVLAAITIDHLSKKELSSSVGLAYIYYNYKT